VVLVLIIETSVSVDALPLCDENTPLPLEQRWSVGTEGLLLDGVC
jgi:hypothetical protein